MEYTPTNIETKLSATPATDKVLAAALEMNADLTPADLILYRNAFAMVGRGFADVQVQYEQGRVEDGAKDELFERYKEKVALHIPEEVVDQFGDDTYADILEEHAGQKMHEAELEVIVAPVIDMVTVESLSPTQEDIIKLQITGLEAAHQEEQAKNAQLELDVIALNDHIRALQLRVAELSKQLGVTPTYELAKLQGGKGVEQFTGLASGARRQLGDVGIRHA
jgi:hypothetical protein